MSCKNLLLVMDSLVFCPVDDGSALDHIELTYHDVTVFAIPEFKSLEVLKKIFCINIIVNQPQN